MAKLFPPDRPRMLGIRPATIGDLIAYLGTLDPTMLTAYRLHSEQCVLEIGDLDVVELCPPRPDGWVQDQRPDIPTQKYLLFPGN